MSTHTAIPPGHSPPPSERLRDGNKIGWVSLRAAFPWLVYLGVTSDNAYSNLCGANGTDPTLSWSASWNTLNNALVNNNPSYPYTLYSGVSAFHL
jgi:hypothetical protein